LKILFINFNQLDSNSGIHVFNLANHLTLLGVECIVSTPKTESMELAGALFKTADIEDLINRRVETNFDLIHVWTPREIVRQTTQALLQVYPCPYILHLEDNEEYLIEAILMMPFTILKRLPSPLFRFLIKPHMSHPLHYKDFLIKASGVTIIIEKLKEFCPKHMPTEIIWAGYQEDLNWNMFVDIELKRSLGIGDNEFVVTYTGNVHRVNHAEIADLYEAIELLYSQGIPIKLIRTGRDYLSFLTKKQEKLKKKYCIELGRISRDKLPSLLSIADVLVQPGKPNAFNNYRFPSKLPEYLASGKPVILPKANIGLHLKNYEECLLLEDGSPLDIAQKLKLLFSDESLRNKIGLGGHKFAEQHLKWGGHAQKLYAFYKKIIDQKIELVK
jgi:glycosyltransferase involved in cell wall biosynthesis